MKFGWPIELQHTLSSDVPIPPNQKGAQSNPQKVDDYLQKELIRKSIIGPFDSNPFGRSARISPIDAIPKKNTDDLRIILNLSYPPNEQALNEAVDKDTYLGREVKLTYPGMDDLVDLIQRIGVGCALFKTDLKHAYRQIYYDPGSIHLVGFKVGDSYYFDITLSQGLRIACFICQRITNAIIFIYYDRGFAGLNYLDDLAGAASWSAAYKAAAALSNLLDELQVSEAKEKICAPDVTMVFIGILANTLTLTLEITPDRLSAIKDECSHWLTKSCCSKKDLQRLVGKLNFAASTVRSGRLFFSRILAFMKTLPKRGIRTFPLPVRKDIRWWCLFLEDFNGVSMMPDLGWQEVDATFSCDASLVGLGGICGVEYFHVLIPEFVNEST